MAKPTSTLVQAMLRKMLNRLSTQTGDDLLIYVCGDMGNDIERALEAVDSLINDCYEDGWNDAEQKYKNSRAELAELVLQQKVAAPAPNIVHAMDQQVRQEVALLMQNQRTQDAQDLHDFRCAALQGTLASLDETVAWDHESIAADAIQLAKEMFQKAKEADRES